MVSRLLSLLRRRKSLLILALALLLSGFLFARVNNPARSGDTLPPGKQEFIDREKAIMEDNARHPERAFDVNNPSTWPSWFTTATPSIEHGIPAGDGEIFNFPSMQGPQYDHTTYALGSSWLWQAPEGPINLDAGYLRQDPEQGLVWLRVAKNPSDVRGGVHLTPKKTGALKITGADGIRVKLSSANGEAWVFHLTEGRFISPVEEPLPTAAPAATPQSTPAVLPVQLVSLDAVAAGNTATSWGAIDTCGSVNSGTETPLDFVIQGLPQAANGAPMGIIGFSAILSYDPSVIKVTNTDAKLLLATKQGANPSSISHEIDAQPGRYIVNVADLVAPSDGGVAAIAAHSEGVIARVTVQGVGSGVTSIDLSNVGVIDQFNDIHTVSTVDGAKIAVDRACG